MKAIFIGTLSAGFKISQIVANAIDAEEIVTTQLTRGKMAEAVDVESPESLDKRVSADPDGKVFVVYGKGLGNGFNVYGPFPDCDIAEDFAETNRSDDDEWELFELVIDPSTVSKDQLLKEISEFRRNLIEISGYGEVRECTINPDKYKWVGCDLSFDTMDQAADDLIREISGHVIGCLDMSSEFWDSLSGAQKLDAARDAFKTDADVLKPISFSGDVKSISDDDLCANCKNCNYAPGSMSSCTKNWPGVEDIDGYVKECGAFVIIVGVLTMDGNEGSDYILSPEATSCWVTVDGFAVYIKREVEGVVVDVYAKRTSDQPLSSQYAFHADAEAALCQSEGIDIDDVAEWVVMQKVNFDEETGPKRHEWICKYIQFLLKKIDL